MCVFCADEVRENRCGSFVSVDGNRENKCGRFVVVSVPGTV